MALINTEIKPFKATAYRQGEFVDVSSDDLKGKWSIVFFYPADFTFVCPTELGDLASVQTLHVLSPKTNPYGRTYLTLINKGLRTMRESGEWFEVVSRHLALHAQNQQN